MDFNSLTTDAFFSILAGLVCEGLSLVKLSFRISLILWAGIAFKVPLLFSRKRHGGLAIQDCFLRPLPPYFFMSLHIRHFLQSGFLQEAHSKQRFDFLSFVLARIRFFLNFPSTCCKLTCFHVPNSAFFWQNEQSPFDY